jgi:hypothetical protein
LEALVEKFQWGTRIGLSTARWVFEIGTFLLRTEFELIFKNAKSFPTVFSTLDSSSLSGLLARSFMRTSNPLDRPVERNA